MEHFSQKFRSLCYDKGLTQAQTAEFLGVGQKTISNWMSGKIIPNEYKITKIAEKFGIDKNYLLTDNAEINGRKVTIQNAEFQKMLTIRNEIQKVFDSVSASLKEIDEILNRKKF